MIPEADLFLSFRITSFLTWRNCFLFVSLTPFWFDFQNKSCCTLLQLRVWCPCDSGRENPLWCSALRGWLKGGAYLYKRVVYPLKPDLPQATPGKIAAALLASWSSSPCHHPLSPPPCPTPPSALPLLLPSPSSPSVLLLTPPPCTLRATPTFLLCSYDLLVSALWRRRPASRLQGEL